MIRVMIALTLVFLLARCARPEEVMEIDEDKIVQILVDLHVIEASLTTVNTRLRDSIQEVSLQRCADMHRISVEELKEKLLYIDRRPSYQRQIYDRVLDTLGSYMDRADELSVHKDTTAAGRPAVNKTRIRRPNG